MRTVEAVQNKLSWATHQLNQEFGAARIEARYEACLVAEDELREAKSRANALAELVGDEIPYPEENADEVIS
jgi:hypothetical protein